MAFLTLAMFPHSYADIAAADVNRSCNSMQHAATRSSKFFQSENNFLQPIRPKLQRLTFLFLIGVLHIDAKRYSCFCCRSMIGNMTKDDWCNAEFCHLGQ